MRKANKKSAKPNVFGKFNFDLFNFIGWIRS